MNELTRRLRAALVPIESTVVERRPLGRHLLEIRCDAPSRFAPGDVLSVRVGGATVGPAGTWRRYTIAGTDDHSFRLLIERNPLGASAPFFDALRPGSAMTVRGPAAPVLPPVGDDPLLIVTDLTGLATVAGVLGRHEVPAAAATPRVAAVTVRPDVDASTLADCWHVMPDTTVLGRPDQLDDWLDEHHRPRHRVLAVGGHELVSLIRRTIARRDHRPRGLRTHVYWKPGRRGLE